MNIKRIFLIVLDSVGIGEMPDSKEYGDEGSNTLGAVAKSEYFKVPTMQYMGLFNIDGVTVGDSVECPTASFARIAEKSKGKDTTIGHWEIAGLISKNPLPTFPNGFPQELIADFEKAINRKVICNKPYSGTQVIMDYGREHIETGNLIVYTSADSVFQIAAHESIVPVEELYEYCRIARRMLHGKYAVGRVIARPFEGEYPDLKRTSRRHDFSLEPTGDTMLDILSQNGFDVISVGKINDIFASKGITDHRGINTNNIDGMNKTLKLQQEDFNGLCFVNLVDFDMVYGHRNDIDGYAKALSEFDKGLNTFISKMKPNDVLIITADHGCDPSTVSTDHSREYVPLLIFGDSIKKGVNIGTRSSFADISATILDFFNIDSRLDGLSFKEKVIGNE